ncbi:putative integrase [Legionella beliardensis]|uniref:Putative integrase n=1 Tax=Legionella beliardensis TaxID=91822 RepID=A0A378JNP8_9GAMM|nr:phage integrase N-terminal domain-containing protein [Legionella beliardensis]STX55504.1 putative integrase [Legionella beliardensis]
MRESKTKLKSAEFSINQIVKHASYQSYASQNDMRVMLRKCVRDLHTLGFKLTHVKGFKPKHIYKLVDYWKQEDKSPATIKNYLSKLRELGKLLEDKKLVKPDNKAYKIGRRQYFPEQSKAIHHIDFSKCSDSLIRLSMEGQYLFGLRREESIKFNLSQALIKKDAILLAPSWTKGGIGRSIPITNQAQRDWLERVGETVKYGQSLIYEGSTYAKQLNKYAYQTRLMGLKQLHGLRHSYAQRRYKELTAFYDLNKRGWECPFNGGTIAKEMSKVEQDIDFKVRHILTRELGHSRLSILNIYLG